MTYVLNLFLLHRPCSSSWRSGLSTMCLLTHALTFTSTSSQDPVSRARRKCCSSPSYIYVAKGRVQVVTPSPAASHWVMIRLVSFSLIMTECLVSSLHVATKSKMTSTQQPKIRVHRFHLQAYMIGVK
jgi:hypothetical protein